MAGGKIMADLHVSNSSGLSITMVLVLKSKIAIVIKTFVVIGEKKKAIF
jgi:hypothetical protein